jgi:hypothetical protein
MSVWECEKCGYDTCCPECKHCPECASREPNPLVAENESLQEQLINSRKATASLHAELAQSLHDVERQRKMIFKLLTHFGNAHLDGPEKSRDHAESIIQEAEELLWDESDE